MLQLVIVSVVLLLGMYMIHQGLNKITDNINKNSRLISNLETQLNDSQPTPTPVPVLVPGGCPPDAQPVTIYNNYPATFEEEYIDPLLVSDVFEDMFSEPSPWIGSIRTYDRRKQEGINRYFINQH